MKTLKLIFIALFGIFLGGCHPKEPLSEDMIIIRRIMSDHTVYICSQYPMDLVGHGGGFMHDINKVALRFIIIQKSDIENSRNMMVQGIYDLLRRINKSEEVRPYLSNYPFTENNISYSISFYQNKRKLNTEGVAYAFLVKGKIYYSAHEGPDNWFLDLHEEPYQEALEIVRNDHPELLEVQPEKNKR